MEAPIYLHGLARKGPTFREAVLMHAVARLALHPVLPNIQASWVKLGAAGAAACLAAGANDLGGTLMNESISRAAGRRAWPGNAAGGDGDADPLERAQPWQRTTLYNEAPAARRRASFGAAALSAPIDTPARRYERAGSFS